MKRIFSRFKGMTKRCKHCPQWTPNQGGVCTRCLNLGMPERVKAEATEVIVAKPKQSISRLINEILRERPRRSEPLAVSRGRGVSVMSC